MARVVTPKKTPSTDGTVQWFARSLSRSWEYQAKSAAAFLLITWPVFLLSWFLPGGLVGYLAVAGSISITASGVLRNYDIDFEALVDSFASDPNRRRQNTSHKHVYVLLLAGGTFFVGLAVAITGIAVFLVGLVAPGLTLLPAFFVPIGILRLERWDVAARERSIVARGIGIGEIFLRSASSMSLRDQENLSDIADATRFLAGVAFYPARVQSVP